MPRSPLFWPLLLAYSLPAALFSATLITVEGEARWQTGKAWNSVALGQRFKAGDLLETAEASSLHLVMDDGSSITLGPSSSASLLSLKKGAIVLKLAKGSLFAQGASLELQTPNAIVLAENADFEVQASREDSSLIAAAGSARIGDPARKRFETAKPRQRRRFTFNRMLAAETLSRRDASAFAERWQRSKLYHQQRELLMKNLKK